MNPLEERSVDCPYCGEVQTLLLDCSVTDQSYVEDCQVCCRPMVVQVHLEGDTVAVQTNREDD